MIAIYDNNYDVIVTTSAQMGSSLVWNIDWRAWKR